MYGTSPLNGRLEFCYNGLWGTICSGRYTVRDNWYTFVNTWSDVNANVACKQLGYARIGASWTTGTNPTQDTRGILLSDIYCSGNETSLQSCTHNPIGYHHCDHDHDVTLKCQGICIMHLNFFCLFWNFDDCILPAIPILQHLVQIHALMGTFALRVETSPKEEWKCATRDAGYLCVGTIGGPRLLQPLPAES